ncbi:MAG: aminomethyl-transferring glycine dehydrogenase subunit GcvPB [Holophagales bacterium]|nr:aminomethyl-transferring glycine dehydrogenase subunit GcvPB [Holophagales bacterium]
MSDHGNLTNPAPDAARLDRRRGASSIFDASRPGRRGVLLPPLDVPGADPEALFGALHRTEVEGEVEASEVDAVRHFTRLSQKNLSIDANLYPLGSCTMKHNPRINEEIARLAGFADVHPYTPGHLSQGALELMARLEAALIALTGFARVTLQPSAGANGELAGCLMIRAAHVKAGAPRKYVLVPDSAHGTNPASAHFAGYQVKELASTPRGTLDPAELEKMMTDEVAAVMITVPNTLGVFEENILEVTRIVHAKGGYVYLDGANFNAFVGKIRPADMGVDVMHMNLHKTFSTPHGGGGPGAGPVGVGAALVPFLPVPTIEPEGTGFRLDFDRPDSIGRMRTFYGNFGVLVRALTYILSYGQEIGEVAENAVLNANYLRKKLAPFYHLKYDAPSYHEVVFDDTLQAAKGVHNIDVAKRLMDYGFHPPTMSFPLIVHGALMIEPTESEPIEELDAFADAMIAIAREAEESPELVTSAPHVTPVGRVDEALLAREASKPGNFAPVLRAPVRRS